VALNWNLSTAKKEKKKKEKEKERKEKVYEPQNTSPTCMCMWKEQWNDEQNIQRISTLVPFPSPLPSYPSSYLFITQGTKQPPLYQFTLWRHSWDMLCQGKYNCFWKELTKQQLLISFYSNQVCFFLFINIYIGYSESFCIGKNFKNVLDINVFYVWDSVSSEESM
jgi:hypothetical protein